MKRVEKTLPQWEAPDTLLSRVINELDKKTCVLGFYSWSAVYRYIFCIVSVAIAGIVFLIAYGIGSGWDALLTVNIFATHVAIWYNCLLTIQTVFYDLLLRFLRQPAILLAALVFAIIIIITWTGSVAALYQMLSMHHRRKYI